MSITQKSQYFNLRLTLACLLIAVSQFNYGFDNQAFATSQAMDSFIRQFGSYNAKTKKYYIETYWSSLFNSLPLVGFATGELTFGLWFIFRLSYPFNC